MGDFVKAQLRSWSAKGGTSYEEAFEAGQMDASFLVGASEILRVRTGADPRAGQLPLPGLLTGLPPFVLNPVPVMLDLQPLGGSVRLSWPGYATNYALESQATLGSTNWQVIEEQPVIVNGRNTVTNVVDAAQSRFYRLRKIE